jgi:hypothetical protein
MSDPTGRPEVSSQDRRADLFSVSKTEPSKRGLVFGVSAASVLLLAVAGVILIHRSPAASAPLNAVLPSDPYAADLSFTQLAMSESTSLSGGKSTFIDGHVRNSGGETLTAMTMQVLFKNDEGLAPTVDTLPLTLIRTREPYVDTEAVDAAPLKPGDDMEFRLIFETVPPNWNEQMPELRVVHLTKR